MDWILHHADIYLQYTWVDVIELLNLCHQNKLNTYNIYIFGKFHESTKFNNSGKIINKFIIEKTLSNKKLWKDHKNNTRKYIRWEELCTLYGWNARQLAAPILCPRNPSWYLMVLRLSPDVLYTPMNWLGEPLQQHITCFWTTSLKIDLFKIFKFIFNDTTCTYQNKEWAISFG